MISEELVQDTRVHRNIYPRAKNLRLEMERIFERNWVFSTRERGGEAGDYKTVRSGRKLRS